LIEEL